MGKPDASVMKLSHPTHIRLTQDLLQRLDSWRGDRMNRATAIRLLLEQALEQPRR
jgi:metal-responsive CopG/Arc/MetJ family transcriptional regulator